MIVTSKRLIAVIALLALMGLADCAEQENESINTSEPSAEALATKYLQAMFIDSTELEEVVLLPGKLPDEMPIELPMPNSSTIFGSVVIGDTEIGVIVNSTLAPEVVMGFYRDTLSARNWTETDIMGMERGFVGGPEAAIFCRGRDDPSLVVSVYPLNNGTDLRLDISTDTEYSPCAMSDSSDWLKPLPRLAAPRNASISNQNFMSGCTNQVSISTDVETELSSAELAAHYGDQLTAANWTALEKEECGRSAWSTWQFTDEEGLNWNGFLIALEAPGSEGKKFVMMQAAMEVEES